jgi:hypothetical protein
MSATNEPRQTAPSTLDYLSRAGKLRPIPAEEEAEASRDMEQPPTTGVRSSNPSLELFAARAFLGSIRSLQSGNPDGVRLFDAGREIGMTADVLIPLARRLESVGLLFVEEPDAVGDDLVTLTDEAVAALDSRDPQTLTRSLQLEVNRGGSAESI